MDMAVAHLLPRKAVVPLACLLLVFAAAKPALAADNSPMAFQVSGLTLERGRGEVRMKISGTVVGRIASGRITLRGSDKRGNPLAPPANCQPIPGDDRSPIASDGTIRCEGEQIRLGIFGASLRLEIAGKGVSISVVGRGAIAIKGQGKLMLDGGERRRWPARWRVYLLDRGRTHSAIALNGPQTGNELIESPLGVENDANTNGAPIEGGVREFPVSTARILDLLSL